MSNNSEWNASRLLLKQRYWPILALMAALLWPGHSAIAGTWVPLNNQAPDYIDTMLLLPDGTVMATAGDNGNGTSWYRLTPDSHGSYVDGTWSTLASMHYPRLYFSSQVLTNGEVFVAGAEYGPDQFSGPGTTNGEIYNPQLNTWTMLPNIPDASVFLDSDSAILPNGNVLITPVEPDFNGETLIWNTASNTWSVGPTLVNDYNEDEASWVKLPDNSILTIDSQIDTGGGTNSERYIPSLNQWINDANVPVQIYDTVDFEMGPAFLLPNGKAIFPGATGNTAIYTPSGGTSPGTWTAGPVLPNSLVTADDPGAMMVNGKILYTMSPNFTNPPTSFFEYDPMLNSFAQVSGPTGTTFPEVTFAMRMLDLPDGTVLFSTSDPQLYVYQPTGSPLAAGQPVINTLTTNSEGSYHLTGTLFNGISEGAAYGDDAQMDSNYPLVRMTNSLSGLVYYARTYNWSSTGVMTGTNIVSTDFVLPVSLPTGVYSLVVTANGNASAPITFTYTSSQLVQNGGFETGDFTDWGLVGDTNAADLVNLVTNYNFEYADFAPYSGNYCAYMGQSGFLAYLSQTNLTVPGQAYLFSSWMNSPDGITPNECSVSWNGNTLFDETNMPPLGWTNLAFYVTATQTNTVIQFGFRDDYAFLGLDDVTVVPVQVPVFTSVMNSSGTISLTWSATSGLIYQLQYATNLTSGGWFNLGSPITAGSSTVTTTDPSPSGPQRFYHVMLVP